VWEFDDILEAVYGKKTDKTRPPEHMGFVFLIDFTVNDEDVNHFINYTFKRDPQ
jgi:hypothetical protein